MIKIIKHYFKAWLWLVLFSNVWNTVFDTRPIKYERFFSETSFRKEVAKLIPIGSRISDASHILYGSVLHRVQIWYPTKREVSSGGHHPNTQYILYTEYYSDILSLGLGSIYCIDVEVDENGYIVDVCGDIQSLGTKSVL